MLDYERASLDGRDIDYKPSPRHRPEERGLACSRGGIDTEAYSRPRAIQIENLKRHLCRCFRNIRANSLALAREHFYRTQAHGLSRGVLRFRPAETRPPA